MSRAMRWLPGSRAPNRTTTRLGTPANASFCVWGPLLLAVLVSAAGLRHDAWVVAAQAGAGSGAQPEPTGIPNRETTRLGAPRLSYERYAVLSERNIFLRERGRPSYHGSSSRPAPTTRSAEQSFVLTGVVFEEGEFRAYVESTDPRSVLRLRVGDAVARGSVTRIDIDAVEYMQAGGRTWIALGRDFTGGQVSTTQPASAPALPNPNDPNLTMEQKMRLRRMQELNRR